MGLHGFLCFIKSPGNLEWKQKSQDDWNLNFLKQSGARSLARWFTCLVGSPCTVQPVKVQTPKLAQALGLGVWDLDLNNQAMDGVT